MGDLFEVYQWSVLAPALECLAKNWIKWLLKALIIYEGWDVSTDDHFHSLQRVILQLGRLVEIRRHCTKIPCYDNQGGLGGHTSDREAYTRQVEVTVKDLAPSSLNKFKWKRISSMKVWAIVSFASDSEEVTSELIWLKIWLTATISVITLRCLNNSALSRSSKPPLPDANCTRKSSVYWNGIRSSSTWWRTSSARCFSSSQAWWLWMVALLV